VQGVLDRAAATPGLPRAASCARRRRGRSHHGPSAGRLARLRAGRGIGAPTAAVGRLRTDGDVVLDRHHTSTDDLDHDGTVGLDRGWVDDVVRWGRVDDHADDRYAVGHVGSKWEAA
jgi:hypothetical protein